MINAAEREELQELLGRIVILWGDIMGLVYGLPADLKFDSPDAIKISLAHFSGDGTRVDHLIRLLKHQPKFAEAEADRIAAAIAALTAVKKLVDERDSLIHGVPVFSMARDPYTREVIRNGWYFVQTRKLDEKDRYLKVPEAARALIPKLEVAHEGLLRVARSMLFEDWERLWITAP